MSSDGLCRAKDPYYQSWLAVQLECPWITASILFGLSHKAQGKQGLVNVHKIQTSLYNAFAAWLQWNEEAVVSLSLSLLSLLFYKQKLHYQTICLVIMKAVGASLIWCGTAKLLNAPCWQGPIQMWQRAQSSSSHTHTDAYTLVKGGTGKATKKLQTPFLCI